MSDWINDRTPAVDTRHTAWHVVVPVKGGPSAKTRLRAPAGVDHPALAMAIALDSVVAAAAAVGPTRVLVVTADPAVSQSVESLGVAIAADPGGGLNAAVQAGVRAAVGMRDGAATAVAVLLGDVPALRPEELRRALRVADEHERAYIPDAEGTGTVLLTWRSRADPDVSTRFGAASAAAHAGEGHAILDLDLPGLRRDVDDIASLQTALGLGVGRHTASVLAHLLAPDAMLRPSF